jgi:peptidoglycan/xylan/chitin deacetylase (PgdA/CDA1 family)
MLTAEIKTFVCEAMARSGLPRLLHKVFFADKLTIVMYHGVVRSPLKLFDWCFIEEGLFRSQLTYLKAHFDVVPLSTAVRLVQDGEIKRPTAAITFDDGYQNNYSVAFPILRELSLPATIFIATGFIDTEDTFWNLRLNRSLANTTTNTLSWNGSTFDLNGTPSREKANVSIRKSLRDLPRPQLLARLDEVLRALGEELDSPIEADSPFRMLDSRMIAEMAASGLVDFGAHSHSHRRLSRLSPKECREEIEMSVSEVRRLTGRSCDVFAYPLGRRQDYSRESVDVLRELGIRAAVTTLSGPNDRNVPALELQRYGAGANENMSLFQLKVHHLMPRKAGAS